MSHFTVLVIGSNVEEKLAPYDENMEAEPYREDVEQEQIERMVKYHMEEAKEEDRKEGLDANDLQTIAPLWKDWSGSEMEIDEEGKPFRWCTYNPQSKWDWYEVGGRWQGVLRLKHGTEGVTGKASFMLRNHEYKPEWVDQAKFGDIDWAYMRNDPEQLLYKKLSWKTGTSGKGLYKPEYFLERYGTEREYIRREMIFSTFAVVTDDGEWCEMGEMGWWAVSTESHDDQRIWIDTYWERFLEGLSDDTPITLLDCHI